MNRIKLLLAFLIFITISGCNDSSEPKTTQELNKAENIPPDSIIVSKKHKHFDITYTELWDNWKLPVYPENYSERKIITEKYFRSLYKCFIEQKGKELNKKILFEILNEAANTQPIKFNPEWNNVYWPGYGPNKNTEVKKSDYDLAIQKLQFLIADSRRLIENYENTAESDKPYFQHQSNKGFMWYNFDIWTILNQLDVRTKDHYHQESYATSLIPPEELNWQMIPDMIMHGIIYE